MVRDSYELFPLNRSQWFSRYIVDHPINSSNLINNPIGYLTQ